MFTSKLGTLPPRIGVAGVTLVILTVPVGPAVGTLPFKRSLFNTLPVVVAVSPLPTVNVSFTTVRGVTPNLIVDVLVSTLPKVSFATKVTVITPPDTLQRLAGAI